MSKNDELVSKYFKKLKREIREAGQEERIIDSHEFNASFSDISETEREKTSIQKSTRPSEIQPNIAKKKYPLRGKPKMNVNELELLYYSFYQWFLISYSLLSS